MVDFDFKPGTFVRVSFKHTKMIAHSIFKEIKGQCHATFGLCALAPAARGKQKILEVNLNA